MGVIWGHTKFRASKIRALAPGRSIFPVVGPGLKRVPESVG